MKTNVYAAMALLVLMMLFGNKALALDSSLTEREAKTLIEGNLPDALRVGNCIIMYYNSESPSTPAEQDNPYGSSPIELGDRLMRSLIAMRDETGASLSFYKVNWKNFSETAITKIRSDVSSVMKRPESPSFAAYAQAGAILFTVRGMPRPDVHAFFIGELMTEFIPSMRTDKGEYLRTGWPVMNTNKQYISLADMRQAEVDLSGMTEKVRIVTSRSREYDKNSCEFEELYLTNGKRVGSIENYGKYGKIGYFDYDGTGKLQYRVKYKREAESTGSAPTTTVAR